VTRFSELLRLLAEGEVEFIVVGGAAAAAHGSVRLTQDVDVVYARDSANLERLVSTLAGQKPYLRGAPPGLPFRFDRETLNAGLNFTLTTELGWIDLLGEIAGGGRYQDLLPESTWSDLFGIKCRVLNLDALIRVKRAAGRPKDFEAIAELEILRDRLAR
jgi:predicted nucleotidyltransferase